MIPQSNMDPQVHHTRGHRSPDDTYKVPRLTVPEWESDRVSPLPGKDNQVPPPAEPGTPEFDAEWEDAVRAREETKAGIYPAWLFQKYNPLDGEWAAAGGLSPILEDHFRKHNVRQLPDGQIHPEALAELVRMDYPFDVGLISVEWLLQRNMIELKPEYDRTPGHDSWLDYGPEWHADLTRACADALTHAFEVKSYYAACRPSETVERQKYGLGPVLSTKYPEPNHDRYVAGHGLRTGRLSRQPRTGSSPRAATSRKPTPRASFVTPTIRQP